MSGYRDTNWMDGTLENALVAVDRASADGGDTLSIVYEAPRDCAFALPAIVNADGIGRINNVYQVVDGTLLITA